MTGLQGIKLVAIRELKERGKSKAYLISTVFTMVILIGGIVLPGILGGGADEYTIGLVGEGGMEIVESASRLAEQQAGQDAPADEFETTAFDSVEEAEVALDDDTIDAIIVEGTDLVVASEGGAFGGPSSSLQETLQQAASTLRIQELVAGNENAAEVVQLLSSQPLDVRSLTGEDGAEAALRSGIAFYGLILMYVAVLTYGTWMLSGVTEEKTNRVVEVLLSTLKPWQIFAGKLVGIGALGVGQMAGLIAVGLLALRVSGSIELPALPVDSVVALIGWFTLGFLLYATLFGAAGSLVSRMEDAQTAAAPLSILAVVGYLFSFVALNDPSGTVAVIGTFVPFTAPYVAPIRLAYSEIAAWEMTLAVIITAVTILILVRLAGRVYAGGLLRFGGRLKWREAFNSAE